MVMAGQKRGIAEVEERSQLSNRKVKMRNLESVFRSEERYGPLDLNATLGASSSITVNSSYAAAHTIQETNHKSDLLGIDLNAEDVCSTSSVGPLDEKDSLKVWNEMKQNGFLSNSHGGIPKANSKRGKNEGMKKKMELAKKERVDRFAKIAAPTGLLNGLNPGIINHVRNSKQVHSIIEALVRSEKYENHNGGRRNAIQPKSGERKVAECQPALNSNFMGLGGDLSIPEGRVSEMTDLHLDEYVDSKDNVLGLNLSSAITVASYDNSSLSNEEPANLSSVTSLSVKAANVAAQWLDLLHQDIKGRLAALKRSRKRVRAVIQTEFPCLISREFYSNQEIEPFNLPTSSVGQCDKDTLSAHHARWSSLFGQMDRALTEEERHLECWQKEVHEMQQQCENGLSKYSIPCDPPQVSALQNDRSFLKLEKDAERDLAVRAAAASIYSTCSFLSSMENPSCC
ncbi:unnamed protein product [Cuscuta epithymum]|uniref:Uncharacterized protein n=1 Tax=Cuscuta epithymum TaxID=186058 RepID=A0AAV0CP01_9ASTE|nr:unnamed protein product [Cuscuta epithymum]